MRTLRATPNCCDTEALTIVSQCPYPPMKLSCASGHEGEPCKTSSILSLPALHSLKCAAQSNSTGSIRRQKTQSMPATQAGSPRRAPLPMAVCHTSCSSPAALVLRVSPLPCLRSQNLRSPTLHHGWPPRLRKHPAQPAHRNYPKGCCVVPSLCEMSILFESRYDNVKTLISAPREVQQTHNVQ